MQSARGQWQINESKQTIDELLNDETASTTTEPIRQKLKLVQKVRHFAIHELALPETDSFTEYADLKRDYAIKNLFAAAEFSTQLYTWCYPVIGCASYRGYFDEDMLARDIKRLQQDNYETYIAKIPAYSTLGWFDDPVLNTFIQLPDEQLIALIIHEIAHQQLYIDGDTDFNESFASAVAQAGLKRWFQSHHETRQFQQYLKKKAQKEKLNQLIADIRDDLATLYQQPLSVQTMRQRKQLRLQQAINEYETLKARAAVPDGYSSWFASNLNNAKLGSVNSYQIYVKAFLAILAAEHDNFSAFFQHAAILAELPPANRHQCLLEWTQFAQDKEAVISENCRLQ